MKPCSRNVGALIKPKLETGISQGMHRQARLVLKFMPNCGAGLPSSRQAANRPCTLVHTCFTLRASGNLPWHACSSPCTPMHAYGTRLLVVSLNLDRWLYVRTQHFFFPIVSSAAIVAPASARPCTMHAGEREFCVPPHAQVPVHLSMRRISWAYVTHQGVRLSVAAFPPAWFV